VNQTATRAKPGKQSNRGTQKGNNPKSNHPAKRNNSGGDLDGDDVEGRRRSSHHHQVKLHRKVKVWIGKGKVKDGGFFRERAKKKKYFLMLKIFVRLWSHSQCGNE
jgi:hypothetical protein